MMNPTTHRIAAVVTTLCCLPLAFADPPPGYYDTVNATDSTTLRTTLHAAIDDHQRLPYTSSNTDTWDILELADEDPNDADHILDVYTNASYHKTSGCSVDQDCDDGLYCNGAETCVEGQCQDGLAVQCDDGAACTTDSCNENSETCEHAPDDSACDDGDPCELEQCHPFVGCISFPNDTSPPSITCPPDTTIGCKESSDPENTGEAVAIDDCDPMPLVTFEDATEDNGCDAPGFITRTWTAVDASGNDDSCEQLITILPSACPPDLDGDGSVDAFDLAIVLGSWGACEGCPADFNGDGVVNAADLAQVLGAWGACS